jgi:histidinol-phosphate aminotransferase
VEVFQLQSSLSSEEHGGIDPAELQRYSITADQLIDFSVNSNPFGPSPRVKESIAKMEVSRYPDRFCGEITEKLASLNGISRDQILVGNGTAELIWLIGQAFIKPGDEVLIIGPTFGEYQRAARQYGALITEINAIPPDFIPPVKKVIDYVRSRHPKLVFLCNPNNPTGKFIPSRGTGEIARACGEQTILVLDEAYKSFVNGEFFGKQPEGNCLLLRSMTKDFALAGIRIGYLLAESSLIARIHDYQPSWSVNSFAQAAGLAALSDLRYYQRTLEELHALRERFILQLQENRIQIVGSDVQFMLIPIGSLARKLRIELLKKGIQVRDCASFGLPEFIRVSTQFIEENQRLSDELQLHFFKNEGDH